LQTFFHCFCYINACYQNVEKKYKKAWKFPANRTIVKYFIDTNQANKNACADHSILKIDNWFIENLIPPSYFLALNEDNVVRIYGSREANTNSRKFVEVSEKKIKYYGLCHLKENTVLTGFIVYKPVLMY
jgi:hypothetical protein